MWMRMNWVPTPPSEAGLFSSAGPSSSGLANSAPTSNTASPIFISAWPTRPASSVTSIVVSKPNTCSNHFSAAIGSR